MLLAAGLVLSACVQPPAPGPASGPQASGSSGTDGRNGTTSPPPLPQEAYASAVRLVVERLDTGYAVAAAKWFSGQPVTDPAREQAVLQAADALAVSAAADRDYVRTVFTAQIDASKMLQQSLLNAWTAGTLAPPTTAPDLATEVRPVLDRITTELVPTLARTAPTATDSRCRVMIDGQVAALARPVQPGEQDALRVAVTSLCE